jgi:uncharacterized integral membrane protein
MRFVYIVLIALFVAVLVLLKVQNLDTVTVSLFSLSATLRVSTFVLLLYLFGMLTGGALVGLLRSWVRGATRRR